ncbi:MAG: hypothetical protein I8H68_07540 [Flavobacteriia bacterium]|nr:hypothetical protein [Flavobacteriia bacterium]
MEIQLGFIDQYSNGYSTQLDKQLSTEEYNLFIKSTDELYNYENLKRLYDILILNHNEFIKFVDDEKKMLFENSLSIIGDKENYYKHHLNLNRMFLNYLSSFRTLLDHTETIIKRKYEKESVESTKFKLLTNKIFDNYFAYRFFTKLRNYSQHCGIPIDEFEVSGTMIDENRIKPEYKIEFSSSSLLTKYKDWGAIVSKDLQTKGDFSLFPLLEEMKLALNEFWISLISIFENEIVEAIEYINTNAFHLRSPQSTVCIFSDIKRDDYGNMKYFTVNNIPFDIIDELLGNKNG